MGSKKNKGTKVKVDSRENAVLQNQTDLSKYHNAVSNKSRINYAELKLVRPDSSVPQGKKKEEKSAKKSDDKKQVGTKAGVTREKRDTGNKQEGGAAAHASKKRMSGERPRKKTNRGLPDNDGRGLTLVSNEKEQGAAGASEATAEERYSNALKSGDHYSSAIEKYYLKYPNAKRPKKRLPPRKSGETKRKRKRSSGAAAEKQAKQSMAEIAVKNKTNSTVRERAKSAKDAKAKGTVSSKVANRSFYRRRKKRSGALNVLIVTVIVVLIVTVCASLFFNIKQIKIEGDNPYSEAEVKKLCSFGIGSNILFVDAKELEEKIKKELPYISECSVELKIPSMVVITVSRAEVLGVVQVTDSQWWVVSTNGKILETATNKPSDGSDEENNELNYTPEFSSASELAQSRKLPYIVGFNIKDSVEEGVIVGDNLLMQLEEFNTIKEAFAAKKMRLTSMTLGIRGYEAGYDERIALIFGQKTDKKTIKHYLDEVHHLIYDEGKIAADAEGEIRFYKSRVFFRPKYEQSAEELEEIENRRLERNRVKLIDIGGKFMEVGSAWLKGKLVTE